MPGKHTWTWAKTWRFWLKPWKHCTRCGAALRFLPTGPRHGLEYHYRAPGGQAFERVGTLPPCDGGAAARHLELAEVASYDEEKRLRIDL